MASARFLRKSVMVVCFSLIAHSVLAQAQPANKEFVPSVGQAGKDVIWVPTALALANKMLDLAKVTPEDYVIDLGSGDGRIVITAAKRGARALGIEYNPEMVALSQRNAEKEGVTDKAQFIKADLFETDFSQATVITMFLLPSINLSLRPKILNLKSGTRIVSNSFTMGEWTADRTITVSPQEGCDNSYCNAYFWIVPAKVAGTWKLSQGELTIEQSFQMISGTLKNGSNAMPIADAMLTGDRISFRIGDSQYLGRANGDAMQGTVTAAGKSTTWNATRLSTSAQAPSGR